MDSRCRGRSRNCFEGSSSDEQHCGRSSLPSSWPGLTRPSILSGKRVVRRWMDTRVKPAYDELCEGERIAPIPFSVVITRESGCSSTLRLIDSIASVSGILDPRFRGDDNGVRRVRMNFWDSNFKQRV